MTALVRLEQREGIHLLTLNRPHRHNALVPELLDDLLACVGAVDANNPVILTAAGRSFSTGGDLLGFWQHREDIAGYSAKLVGLLNRAILALYTRPGPVIGAVQGQVTGGSLGLVLACDFVVMHERVTITPWYGPVGFSPDGGWLAMLPALVGENDTRNWLSHNETRSASQCLRMGLASRLTKGDVVAEASAALQCVKPGKRQSAGNASQLEGALERERRDFVTRVQTPEAIEGIEKFLKKT